jgi:hypothetical protein
MTAIVSKLPGVCRQLKVLEDAIASQRRIIANLEGCKLDTASARECLTQLLEQLDRVLANSEIEPHERAAALAYAE